MIGEAVEFMQDPRPKCPFLKCLAGMGVAGNGCCFLRGNPDDPECVEFIDEEMFLREWKEEKGSQKEE